MRAVGEYILASPVVEEVKTAFGLVMSAKDVEDMRYGYANVVSRGSQVNSVEDGDQVIYDKRASFTILMDGEQVTVFRERDVILIR